MEQVQQLIAPAMSDGVICSSPHHGTLGALAPQQSSKVRTEDIQQGPNV